jgi:hypothetical protein
MMKPAIAWAVPALIWVAAAIVACSSASSDGASDGAGAGTMGYGDSGSKADDTTPTDTDGAVPSALDAGSTPRPDAASVACTPARTPSSDGHSPDYDCMASGCHGPGAAVAGLLITVSGTLHSTANGGTPIGGATVAVTDKDGKTIELVTSATGIFWSGVSDGGSVPAGPQGTCVTPKCSTYAAAGPMAAVTVSKCPDAPKACASPNHGECASCHTPGTTGQHSVHLP